MNNTERWLTFVSRRFRSGLVYKDCTASAPAWGHLAESQDPLLLKLQTAAIGSVIEPLIAAGLSPAFESALLVGAPEDRKIVFADVSSIATKARALPDQELMLLIAENLSAMRQPLQGKTVLITRAQKQAGALRELLEAHGARVLEAPAIKIVERPARIAELKDALHHAKDYAWLVLTSVNSVDILDAALKELGQSWTALPPVACIGSATAARVRELGGAVEIVPLKYQAESLAEALLQRAISQKKILLPRAEGSRRVLVEELQSHGAIVHEIQIYRAEVPAGGREELQRILLNESIDFVTFTSSSTVHHFVQMAGDLMSRFGEKIRIASIGPITSSTLREHGLPIFVEAADFTMQGLVDAIGAA
jgi:uroporphyrinogen III methyltransferase/synthase